VNLGFLTPGTNFIFEVPILNQEMLLLHGVASTSCDWLAFGNQVGPPPARPDRLNPSGRDHARRAFRERVAARVDLPGRGG
jgi:hypothetical protein